MTSGNFHIVDPKSIWVDRATRQRKELTDIEELADSIARAGLIHPPVIRRNGELIVGERRWTAIKSLGWTSMPVQYIEDLDPHELRLVELEENIRRKDVPWPEQCLAIYDYHELRKDEEGWTVDKSADALGLKRSSFDSRRLVAQELLQGNSTVKAAPKYSTALKIVERKNERARAAEKEKLQPRKTEEVPILTADFHTWVETYTGPKFNLIHCDFPYGINADQHDQGQAPEVGGYKDTTQAFYSLLHDFTRFQDNFVEESAHLIFWFALEYEGHSFYHDVRNTLSSFGWRLDGRLLIWHKSDGTSVLPDPQRGPRWTYETAFFASRGDRKIVRAVSNLVSLPTTDKYHMSEKPVAVLEHFFRMVCDEYSTLLDPTCGSGNALVAARRLGATRLIGLERDTEFAARARENWIANSSHAGGIRV